MKAKVIRTDEDYESTLERIGQLMDAAPGTPESEELDLLATLVEVYEQEHFAIELPDPVDAIKFRMEQAGLRQRDLIPFIGARSKVSEVLNRKRSLSLRMIRALHDGLGIPAGVLLQEPNAAIPEEAPGLEWDRFPLKTMLERRWLPGIAGSLADIRDKAEEVLRAFLEPVRTADLRRAMLRQHIRSGSKMDAYALLAWRARVLALARRETLPEFQPDVITTDFKRQLVGLSCLDEGPRLAREFLANSGIHMVILTHLPKTHLDGAAMVLPSGAPVVAMTLRYDRLDNFWFTLCHELAHVAMHLPCDDHECFIDDLKQQGDSLEDQADEFAADALIPKEVWARAEARRTARGPDVLALARERRVHPAIVAGRIRWEKRDYRILSSLVGHRKVRKLFGAELAEENE